MGYAQGVMAVTGAVSAISAKNAQKRQMREQAAAQKYFANLRYENDLIAANAQREQQRQQFNLQQMQAQAVRLQEDYNLREQEVQNLIQASDQFFQVRSQLAQQETQAVQQLAEADKRQFSAEQENRLRTGQSLQESEAANQQQNQELAQVAAAIQKGDMDLASFVSLLAAQGQDSSSVSTQVQTQQAQEQAATASARAALESGRFSEQDLQNLMLSNEFNDALMRLGVLDADSQRTATQNRSTYQRQAADATQGNIARERDMNAAAIGNSRGVIGSQRVLQDQAMRLNEQFADLGYQNQLTSLELGRAAQNESANQQNRAARQAGAGIFDFVNLGVGLYGATQPLFSRGGAASNLPSVPGKELMRIDTGSSAYMG